MRPWEWANLAGDDARFWLECVAIANAIEEGRQAARQSKAGFDRMVQLDTESVGDAG